MSFFSDHYDLITPDGRITQIASTDAHSARATLLIEEISSAFVGYHLPRELVTFNLKSTLAQLGLDGIGHAIDLSAGQALVEIELRAISPLARQLLPLLTPGAYVGKLFAADERRRVRDADYLTRMFNRKDRYGRPLLSLGGRSDEGDLLLEKIDGRTVAFLQLLDGRLTYEPVIAQLLPLLARALHDPNIPTRSLVQLHQIWNPHHPLLPTLDEMLLVRTLPLHIRTVFGRVVPELLSDQLHHTSASILQPDTMASGDIYEFFGNSSDPLNVVPLEFYTLEPYREHVFFSDRDQLQTSLENPATLYRAFETAPAPPNHLAATYVVKGGQLLNLSPKDWISTEPKQNPFPGLIHPGKQMLMVDHYIQQQPAYPYLRWIEEGSITSQGILLTRYFPTPLLKQMLLSSRVQECVKGIYFETPSLNHGQFFSHEDRSLLHDLTKFAIPVYWVDRTSQHILQYVSKPEKDSGMFVPLHHVRTFLAATTFGIYGSNLIEGDFEHGLHNFMAGVLSLKERFAHPMINAATPLALITGGGPGAMAVGNRVAKALGILSCANIVDFETTNPRVIHEQRQNSYIDAKMTYRLDHLVERQAEFHLDFPIFLPGGIGTDFEYALEEVRRKVGAAISSPIFLMGPVEYWSAKISSRFQTNLRAGTIAGSEWISNCFFVIETAAEGLEILASYLDGTLAIGKDGPIYSEGFRRIHTINQS
jgi:predicted Rossmann-fold nucleotide-binding protein